MYKFTNIKSEMRNVPIDLRYESEILTEEFGIYVLYVRNNKFVRCKCFDDLNKTGDPNCKLCLGSGYFASIQRIKVIESSINPYRRTSSIIQTNIGVTDQKNEVYYIRQQYNPKERDMILKVTWDKDGNPVDLKKVLEIINVWDMRGDQGRSELYGCVISDRTDLMKSYNELLHRIPFKGINEILKGGKYIWPYRMLPS